MIKIFNYCRELEEKKFDADQVILEEGGKSNKIYVLIEGEVIVEKDGININAVSDPGALDAAAREILHRITNAKRPLWLPGVANRRFGCVAEAQALIEASGLPFYTALQDQGILSETHPQYRR